MESKVGKLASVKIPRTSGWMEPNWRFEKSNNSGINLTRRTHDEEEGLCKLMINGVARHHRERERRTAGDG